MSKNPVPRILALAIAAACLVPGSVAPDPQVQLRKTPQRTADFDEKAYRARIQLSRQQLSAAESGATVEFEGRRIAFERRQAAALESQASLARDAIARLARGPRSSSKSREAQIAEIRSEAVELYRRSKGASAAERARIDRRARELVERLHRLGVGR